MDQPAEQRHRASYADLEAVPSNKVAELVNGRLQVSPFLPPRLAHGAFLFGAELGAAFDAGMTGPGGWWILHKVEVHFGSADGLDVLVPDIAGWRRGRAPELPDTHFTLAPDWICELQTPATAKVDREEKMPIYAREGVPHAWLVDPIARTLEVFTLGADRRWLPSVIHRDAARIRAEPFDAIEIALELLWAK